MTDPTTPPPADAGEVLYAIRRADGETIGEEFTFLTAAGPDDWSTVDDEIDALEVEDAPIVFELVRFDVTVVGTRTAEPKPACDEWQGRILPPVTRVEVIRHWVNERSQRQREQIARFDSRAEAEAAVAALPDLIPVLLPASLTMTTVARHDLEVVDQTFPAFTPACTRCSRYLNDHPDRARCVPCDVVVTAAELADHVHQRDVDVEADEEVGADG